MNRGYYIVFDSGVGGLSILKEILNQNVNAKFLYVADNKNGTYGDKTEDHIKSSLIELFDSIERKVNIEGIILACNTASVVAYEHIKERYNVPVYSISKHITKMMKEEKGKAIHLLATERTALSGYFNYNVPTKNVKVHSCSKLASFVESSSFNNPLARTDVIAEELLNNRVFEASGDTVFLACTHYPFLIDEIKSFFSFTKKVIDPAESFVREIKGDIKKDVFQLEITATGEKSKIYDFLVSQLFQNVTPLAQIKLIRYLEDEYDLSLRDLNF